LVDEESAGVVEEGREGMVMELERIDDLYIIHRR
jgi:hypothetical protein